MTDPRTSRPHAHDARTTPATPLETGLDEGGGDTWASPVEEELLRLVAELPE